MSARNNIDNYASFNIRDLMPTTRNFIKAQIVEAQSVIKKATPMYNSQFHQKPLSKSILGKRSQSVHRLATISTRNEPSQDVIYVNSRKLDTMMPLGNETVETGGDDNKDMNLKYKNLNRLMKSEKEMKVVPKERLIGPFAQAKKVQGENRDWQTLPEEFKKIPLFQAIYLKKKDSLIDYRLLAGDDVPSYMKSNYKVPDNLRFWKPSSEHKEPEEIKSQSKVDSNNKFEYDSKYYGVDTIRYQNYKYHKVLSNVKERRYSPNKMFEQKISVEFLAHDIHTQRRSIKELENQRIEIMQKREQMKNDKRQSQPRTSKQQQNVSLDHINEEDKESQKTIENNNLNKVYELNMCADMDLISRSKESSLNFIQSERELRSKKGESPKVSPRFNKGSLTERNRGGGGSPEKRKGNSPTKKITAVIGSPMGIEKMYYSKECKQEFEELCQISQDWLEEMKNGGIDNERDEKALQTHMKLHSPKIDAGIYLPVFLETQGMYIRQKKFITDRILLALGLNPLNKFSMINMENFSKFQRIFVAKDASDTELVDFMIQFFKIDDNEEVLQDSFILVLKSMTDRNENYNRFAEVLNSSYDVLLENYRIFGVLRENSGFVDFDNFREVYLSNKMNISDLADLITNLN